MAKNALGQDISFDSTGKMVFTGTPNAKVTADQATQSRANALAFQAQNLAQRQAPTTPPVAPTTPTQGQVTNQQYQPGTLLPGESIIGTRATPQAVNAGVNATITPGGMTQTTGANIPTPTKPVQATLLGADLATTQANQFAQNAVSGLSEAEQARQTSLNALIEQITGQKTQTQLQAENYGAVDTAQQELNDINNQLLTEQNAQRRREEALVATGDLTAEQAQQKINETRRQSISKQADLSIIQMAKQNNYATAKEIADRKVQAQLEADKLKLDTLQFIYTENKELFNKKEQRQFELAQAERTRLLDKQEKELTQINNLAINALQNGAPTSVVQKMQQAKTLAEATKLGGAYVDKLDRTLKQAQIAKAYSDIAEANAKRQALTGGYRQLSTEENARLNSTPEAKTINDGGKFYNALNEYRNAINTYGTGEVFGKGSGAISSAYQTLVGSVKDYYQLGTLDNGVEKLIALGIPKPTIWGQKSARISAIDTQIQGVAKNLQDAVSQLSKTGYASTVEGQGLIGKAKSIAETETLKQLSNEQLLNSLNSVSTSPTLNNQAFFNQYQ